jgi:hypothetical protein
MKGAFGVHKRRKFTRRFCPSIVFIFGYLSEILGDALCGEGKIRGIQINCRRDNFLVLQIIPLPFA